MREKNSITMDEATRQFPFLRDIQIELTYIPLEVEVLELDEAFLSRSLLEDESEAAGHFNVQKTLYFVRDNTLRPISVWRSPTRIYPPAYLHPYSDFPNDEAGWSETVGGVFSRQGLTEVQYIVLYTRGSNGSDKRVNNILIVLVKK